MGNEIGIDDKTEEVVTRLTKVTNETRPAKTVLITGASSGIGLAFARVFARNGYNIALVARREQSLAELSKEIEGKYGISTRIIAKDLFNASAPEEIYEGLQRDSIRIDVRVNCAGLGASGFFSEIDWSKEKNMIQVNLISLSHLTHLFLRDMVQRWDGKILNVASTAAFQPGPLMAVYYATKAYVLSFTEALAEEVKDSGVSVTALRPGPTRTRFQETSDMSQSRLMKLGVMDAETVARIGYEGLMKNKRLAIPGWKNRLLALGVRIMPRNSVTRIARRLNESER
jgi:short-subunit dehydrogenase